MNPPQIAIIDYEMGNLFSVSRACEHAGLHPVITSDPKCIMQSDAMALPGVGAFGDAMENLKRLDLIAPIHDFIETGKLFIGICLGLQLLMTESEEFGSHRGLDVIPGRVVKFSATRGHKDAIKVPQVGWNRIYQPQSKKQRMWHDTPLENVKDGTFMYFVHSFYTVPSDGDVVLSLTDYEGTVYASSIVKGNVFACQFHPEKSSIDGMRIYSTFAEMIKKRKGAHEQQA